MAAPFMYYPGHVPGAPVVDSCAAAQHQQQQQQQQQQQYAAAATVAAAAPYGYYHNGLAAVQSIASAQSMAAVQQQQQQVQQQQQHQQQVLQQQQNTAFYNQHQAAVHNSRTAGYRQQPALPPLPMFYPGAPQAALMPLPVLQEPPAPRDEYVNGGVNQFLDYDLDLMSEFVVKNAYNAFGTDVGVVIREAGSSQTVDLFTKGALSVLSATRLPAVTILMSLDILSKYVARTHASTGSIRGGSVNVVYQNTMVAFVLANKFNDDKTFTNMSWSQATGMDVHCINDFEREWLEVLEWRLFDDKFIMYDDYAHAFETFCQEKRCPSPPNILPTPHSTDNYLSPPSGYQSPVQLSSNVYSSPGFLEKDTNDFYYGRPGVMSSPMSQFTPNSGAPYAATAASGTNPGSAYNCNFYNFGPPPPSNAPPSLAGVRPPLGLRAAPPWNMDDRYGNFATSNFPGFEGGYYCYSAVY